jgi:TPR repeat protein
MVKSAEERTDSGQLSLGKMYFEGTGMGVDYGIALYWFKKVLMSGNDEAQGYIDQANHRTTLSDTDLILTTRMESININSQKAVLLVEKSSYVKECAL